MGALPNQLPGHMPVADAEGRTHVGAIWNAAVPAGYGLSAPEMVHDIASRKIRALYVIGENPAVSEPQSNFVKWMLQSLDLLIVQDIFPTETMQYAHVVFPAAAVGEKDGTYTNAARRIQYSAGGLQPPGEARADWFIVQEMAKALGHTWSYGSAEDIWNEFRQVAPGFNGVSYARLKDSAGIFWPCYDETHAGTPRLYEDGFGFRDRRARFIPVDTPETLMEATDEYPFVLITGRLLEHFNTGEMSRRAAKLSKLKPEALLDINPDDAQAAGLSDNAEVRLTSPYGTVRIKLSFSDSMQPGYLFAPIHFSQPNFNALMSAVPIDPHARMPALKSVPVRIEGLTD